MASKVLKGLTIEIGGDTTKLDKALESVDKKSRDLSKELGEINKLLKLDPKNTELLAQKQKVLSEAVGNTKEKLDKLKEAEKQVQAQFEKGEASEEQVRALQREIVATENKLRGYERAVKETAEQLENMGDAAEEAAEGVQDTGDAAEDSGDGFTVAKGAVATFIGNGLTALVDAAKNAISSLLELAESTREYRNEMAKLDTSFQTAGLSADAANKTYRELYGILGDEGAAVEAAQQLAKISKTEQDLEKNTRILTGVMAEYGNSIPTEGLAEGMAASAAMGEVQGVLADALEWQGVNLEKFNKKLGKLKTEEERAAFIQETLIGLYGESADAYRENNSAVIESNKAQADLAAVQAALGAIMEPLINKLTELKTMALQWLIDTGLPALKSGFEWVKDNIPGIVAVVGALTAAWLTFGGVQKLIDTWNKIVAVSQAALNAVMNANPIGLIITAVTALVAAFVLLWNNCEGFRKFWINLWEGLKNAVNAVVGWIKDNWQALLLFITNPIAGVFKYLYDNFEGFRNFVDGVVAAVRKFFVDLWAGFKNGAASAWQGVKDTFSKVGAFFKDTFSKAWTAVKNVFSTGGKIFDGIKAGIASVFKTVVNAIIRGINKVVAVPFNAINKVLNTVRGVSVAGISPFKGLWKHNPLTVPAIPELAKGGVLEKGQVGLLEGDGAEAVVPLERNTHWLQRVAEMLAGHLGDELGGIQMERQLNRTFSGSSAAAQAQSGMLDKMDKILAAIERGQILTIDGDALVGATAGKMDNTLGQRRALAARGAL